MKKHILGVICGAMLPMCAMAVPAIPTPITVTNPDGTSVEVLLHGDEYYSYVTDAVTGEALVQCADGFWRADAISATAHKSARAQAPRRIAPVLDDGRTTFPTVSDEIHGLVILMQFADTKFSVPDVRNTIDRMLNEEGYSDYGSCGSARDYYIATSGGKFKPTFDIAPIIVTLPETSEYYVGGNRFRYISEALEYAVKAVDEAGFDFSKYDYDKDGVIDNIFFYYAGYGQADTAISTVLWPHQGTYTKELEVDGLKFRSYACSNELKGTVKEAQQPYLDSVGTFIHEFAHVLGLPDWYDTSAAANTKSPNNYDVLDTGSHNLDSTCPPLFNAYERWVCGWLDFEDLTESGLCSLTELAAGGNAYRIPTRNPNEFFVVESRGKSSWDKSLPGFGIAIWRINFDREAWETNKVNINGKPRYEMIQPAVDVYCWGIEYPYIAPMLPYVLKDSQGDCNRYLMDMAYDKSDASATFRFAPTSDLITGATTMHTPTNNPDVSGVNFSWDPVPGATGYLLTVYKGSQQMKEIINDMNEYPVGNVTSYSVNNISYSRYRQELNAYVRVIFDVPSMDISEAISFTPSRLENGVDELLAPDDDVEYYNLQGIRIDNPKRGEVYIIRTKNVKKVSKEIF